jgi:hypothetical protein
MTGNCCQISFAKSSLTVRERVTPCAASALVRRGDPLPAPLRDFVAEFLLKSRKPGRKQPGTGGQDLLFRNAVIGGAVLGVARYGFPLTRNAATRTPSAASIVQKALAALGFHMSEKAVNKIYANYYKNYFSEEVEGVTDLPSDLSLRSVRNDIDD